MSVAAVDTSTLIAFLRGGKGKDVDLFAYHLQENTALICPPVLLEALSNHKTRDQIAMIVGSLKQLDLSEGFWLRASLLRSNILKHGLKAHTADTIIAQCCIDHAVPLITRDSDFKHFTKYGGLKIL